MKITRVPKKYKCNLKFKEFKKKKKLLITAHNGHPMALIFWWLRYPLPLYTGWKLWRGLQQRFYWAWWKASNRIGPENCGDICPCPYFQVSSLINVIQIVHYFSFFWVLTSWNLLIAVFYLSLNQIAVASFLKVLHVLSLLSLPTFNKGLFKFHILLIFNICCSYQFSPFSFLASYYWGSLWQHDVSHYELDNFVLDL